MAIAKGVEKTKEVEVKRYVGVGAFGLLAVNPSRAEQNKLFNASNAPTEEIVYTGTTKAKDAKGNELEVPQIRLNFVIKTDPAIACNNGIDMSLNYTIFLAKGYRYSNKDGVMKVQVVDKFGRFGWVSAEELKAHKVPVYTIKKGEHAGEKRPASLDSDYRKAYIGEEQLYKFIKAILGIEEPHYWDNDAKMFVDITDPNKLNSGDYDCRFDAESIEAFIKGNIAELKDALLQQPNNRVKLMVGVRTAQDGKQYQCVYGNHPLMLSNTNYKSLEQDLLADATANPPRHPNEYYKAVNLEEYKIAATSYSTPSQAEGVDPYAAPEEEDLPADEDLPAGDTPMDEEPF